MRTPRPPRLPAILAGLATLALVVALTPVSAKACSCVPPDMIIDMLGGPDDESIVFSGTVGPAVGDLVPVQVTGWFGGRPPAPIVSLEVDSSDGSSCGTSAPPAGRQFLFVSYETENGAYGLNLCSLAADLATFDGKAMAGRIAARLGPPFAVGTSPPDPSPEPTDDPDTVSASATLETIALPSLGGVLLLVVVVVGVVVIARRRGRA